VLQSINYYFELKVPPLIKAFTPHIFSFSDGNDFHCQLSFSRKNQLKLTSLWNIILSISLELEGVLYTIKILSSGSNSIHSITSFTILK